MLTVNFVGTNFEGWQSQPSRKTVQDNIEKALETFLRHKLRITGCSRTDSGVHAKGLVATFDSPVEFDSYKWLKSLNALLPKEIGVLDISQVSSDFHPIVSSKGKIYCYRIYLGETRDPFLFPFVWSLPGDLDLNSMEVASRDFIGHHNFRSFCASDSDVKSFDREIFEIKFIKKNHLIEIYISGAGFLKQMVRSMVGTLVDIGQQKKSIDSIPKIIATEDRREAGKTAPASGLTLEKVMYHNVISISDFSDI